MVEVAHEDVPGQPDGTSFNRRSEVFHHSFKLPIDFLGVFLPFARCSIGRSVCFCLIAFLVRESGAC